MGPSEPGGSRLPTLKHTRYPAESEIERESTFPGGAEETSMDATRSCPGIHIPLDVGTNVASVKEVVCERKVFA